MHVAVVLSDLRCGGIQRSAILVADGLAQLGHRVTVFTCSDGLTDFFSLPRGLSRIAIGLHSEPTRAISLLPTVFARITRLRGALLASPPDVVVAHAPRVNVLTLLALRLSGIPTIVTEHGDVSPMHWRKAVWYRLRRLCYGGAFAVVSVSQAVDNNVASLTRSRRVVIPNPIAVPPTGAEVEVDERLRIAAQGDLIVGMGRLSHAKGFDVLIQAFASIAEDFPGWTLIIIGDGELRAELEQQVRALQLSERILFAGALPQPFSLLRRASLFVMASRYEGFPLAHGEALACGLPVIATDCPSQPIRTGSSIPGGVRELIRRSGDGVLTPCGDPIALGRAMADLMSDPLRRKLFAERAPEVAARFSLEKIVAAWDALLRSASPRPS
jgi:glycosyltransferase involved in cell wall biosynthesis